MKKIIIHTHSFSQKCQIVFKENQTKNYILNLKKKHPHSIITIITDLNVFYYLKKKLNFIDKNFFFIYKLKPGEKSKSIKSKLEIEKFLFKHRNNRDSVLVALGGGVVGDLVGYVASTFMRGILYYMIPTTLLAMVDSSVGGKTGINNKFGKNLVGTFYQPHEILIDLSLLKTLKIEQVRNGLAEVIKYGIIKEKSIFSMVERNYPKIIALNNELVAKIIFSCIRIKQKVVSYDEKESGYRRILNFGHTVGHALELLKDYKLLHGFAISIGMTIEAFFSYKLNYLNFDSFLKIINMFRKAELPFKLDPKISAKKLYETMLLDKKSMNKKLYFNLINQIGEVNANKETFRNLIENKIFFKLIGEFKTFNFANFSNQ